MHLKEKDSINGDKENIFNGTIMGERNQSKDEF